MTKEQEKKQIEMAEQQLVGYAHAKRGYSLTHLISSMGLEKEEWEKIKRNYKPNYLLKNEIREVNEYFKK